MCVLCVVYVYVCDVVCLHACVRACLRACMRASMCAFLVRSSAFGCSSACYLLYCTFGVCVILVHMYIYVLMYARVCM